MNWNRHLFFGVAALSSASLGQPIAAQDMRERMPPLGQCTPIYAVQKDGCVLEKFFQCNHKGQPTIRAESYAETGLYYIDFTDQNGNTLLSWSWNELGDVVDLVKTPIPFSMSDLERDGQDDFDVTQLVTHEWFADPVPSRFTARVQLTGDTIEVDGIVFDEAKLVGQTLVNAFATPVSRYYYFDFELGTFPWGSTDEEPDEGGDQTFLPLEVVFPDDPAFQNNQPQYGCGTLSQRAPNLLRRVKG